MSEETRLVNISKRLDKLDKRLDKGLRSIHEGLYQLDLLEPRIQSLIDFREELETIKMWSREAK